MKDNFAITAFYKFFTIPEKAVQNVQDTLHAEGKRLGIRGLILVAPEGMNGTISGTSESLVLYKGIICDTMNRFDEDYNAIDSPGLFKDSFAEENPCKRWFVKIRKEIVAIGDTTIVPDGDHHHLTPTEWNEVIENEDVVILDTRNDYETKIGVFKGAVDPALKQFSEFPEWVAKELIPKDKKVLMYCTGGIRCEKALIEMEKQGYNNVFQLKGGILQYMKEYPHKHFEGECFVFDHRASVDQDLQPSSRYSVCPFCGDPGDQDICCAFCENEGVMCEPCREKHEHDVCSKDCRERLRRKMAKERRHAIR